MRQLALLTNTSFAFDPPQKRSNFKGHPEIRLLALLVIVVKLFNPFGALERYPRSFKDIGSQAVDWSLWEVAFQRAKARIERSGPFAPGGETQLDERDVFALSDEQVDAYLDWYDDLWTDTEHRSVGQRPLPKELLDMFPTERSGLHPRPPDLSGEELEKLEEAVTNERLETVQAGLKSLEPLADDDRDEASERILRVGDEYPVYDDEADLPDKARPFFAEVAHQAGLSLETLVSAVSVIEKRILKAKYDILAGDRIGADSQEGSQGRLDYRVKGNKERLNRILKEGLGDSQGSSRRSSTVGDEAV